MNADFPAPSSELEWLLADLAERVRQIRGVALLSSDGLLKAAHGLGEVDAQKLAVLSCSMLSLGREAGKTFDHDDLVRQAVVELADSILLVTPAGYGSALAVLAERAADAHVVAHEMGKLIAGVQRLLATPARPAAGDVLK